MTAPGPAPLARVPPVPVRGRGRPRFRAEKADRTLPSPTPEVREALAAQLAEVIVKSVEAQHERMNP
jgi:hypothetical protein